MATETTATLSNSVKTYYDRVLLVRNIAVNIHNQFGQVGRIAVRGGKTIEFRRYNSLTPATTALTEGVAPAGSNLSVTLVSATIEQLGDFVKMSDVLETQAVDEVGQEAAELLGEQSGETMDLKTRDVLAAGTTVQYAGGVAGRANVAIGNKLTSAEVKKAVRTHKRNKAKRINGFYVCLCHVDAAYDLMNDSEWIAVNQYNGGEAIYAGELGRIHGVRFVESTNAKVFAAAGSGGIDVYASLFLGANAYGIVSLAALGLEFIYKPRGSAGTSDPLNQVSTAGWKASHIAKILQDLFMCRVEHACTA